MYCFNNIEFYRWSHSIAVVIQLFKNNCQVQKYLCCGGDEVTAISFSVDFTHKMHSSVGVLFLLKSINAMPGR